MTEDPRLSEERPPATPRWVKISGALLLIAIAVAVVVHLAGGGMGNHFNR